jgi:N-acetylglucosaminyl-diphospho-decaprenol L-rhamnosyltransferase
MVAYRSVGGFDEAYFMYVEDLDLCWRLSRAGWSVRIEPSAVVTHAQGLSAKRHPYKMLVAHHVSTWRFAVRSLSGTRRLLLPLIAAGLLLRLAVAVAREAAH